MSANLTLFELDSFFFLHWISLDYITSFSTLNYTISCIKPLNPSGGGRFSIIYPVVIIGHKSQPRKVWVCSDLSLIPSPVIHRYTWLIGLKNCRPTRSMRIYRQSQHKWTPIIACTVKLETILRIPCISISKKI